MGPTAKNQVGLSTGTWQRQSAIGQPEVAPYIVSATGWHGRMSLRLGALAVSAVLAAGLMGVCSPALTYADEGAPITAAPVGPSPPTTRSGAPTSR